MIRFSCPGCRKALSAPLGTEGRTTRCSACRRRLVVPVPATPLPPEEDPEEAEEAARFGPSAVARLLWFVVLAVAVLFTTACVWFAVRAVSILAETAAPAYREVAQGGVVFAASFLVLVSLYMAAWALDRLTQ